MQNILNIKEFDTSPDIKWTVVANDGDKKQFVLSDNFKSKSIGSVHTPLELHSLMHKTLSIVSPNIAFYSDFPNYILGEEEPPVISSIDRLPHNRDDLLTEENATGRHIAYSGVLTTLVPTITWGIVRSEPGTVGGKAFHGDREIKPREREAVAIFSNNDKKFISSTGIDVIEKYGKILKYVKIYGQSFDNLVQYNIWTRSAWEAEELTEWFQDFMLDYIPMFREAGITQMYFDRRVRDSSLEFIKNKYHVRSMLYYFRTEKIKLESVLPIDRVHFDLITSSLSDHILNPDTYVSDSNYDKIVEKWIKFNNEIYI